MHRVAITQHYVLSTSNCSHMAEDIILPPCITVNTNIVPSLESLAALLDSPYYCMV